mgnify:CR=1 FL=1
MNNKKLQKKINSLVELINKEIIREYCNVMLFLEADPIVIETRQQQENTETVLETKPVGYPTKTPTSFKKDLMESLGKKGKEIYVKFERFTRTNFVEALREGCRIMYLNYQNITAEGIMAEDAVGRAETITNFDLQKIFKVRLESPKLTPWSPPQNSLSGSDSTVKSLDLLILAAKNDAKTAAYCSNTLKIPYVVYFEFHERNIDFIFKAYEDFCEKKFTMVFLGKLLEQFSVRESYDYAAQNMFDSVSEEFFESENSETVKSILGPGPILLSHYDDSDKLYGANKYKLRDGNIQDLSRKRLPTNIPEGVLPFTGRKQDINSVFKLLHSFNIVKVEGDAGVGKTAFAFELGRFAQLRDLFPDGVFYFPLKLIENDYSLKEMMLDIFGSKIEDSLKGFFRGKKMLIIFDDFEVFYTEGIEFPETIFNSLRECKIKVLLFVTSLKSQSFAKNAKQRYELRQNQIESKYQPVLRELKPMEDEELAYIAASLEKKGDFKSITASTIQRYSTVAKFAEGNPKRLIDELKEKNVKVDDNVIEIDPKYIEIMNSESNRLSHFKEQSLQTIHLRKDTSSDSRLYSTRLSKKLSSHSLLSTEHENILPAKIGGGLSRAESFQNLSNLLSQKDDKAQATQTDNLDDLSNFTLEGPSKQVSRVSNGGENIIFPKEHLNVSFNEGKGNSEFHGKLKEKLEPLLGVQKEISEIRATPPSYLEEEKKIEPGAIVDQDFWIDEVKRDSLVGSEMNLEYSYYSDDEFHDDYYEEEDLPQNGYFSEGENIDDDQDSDVSDESYVLHTVDDDFILGGKAGRSKKTRANGKKKPVSTIQKERRKAARLNSKHSPQKGDSYY